LKLNTSGESNTANGFQALLSNTSGYKNTANGVDALLFNTIGGINTASGYRALYSNINGNHNTATGNEALRNNTSGSFNSAYGDEALLSNWTGDENTGTGFRALNSNLSGTGNTANGLAALLVNTTGSLNTAMGVDALEHNNGNYNTAAGYQALEWNGTGSNNTGSGSQSLYFNTTGSNNIAVGFQAGYYLSGNNNIAIGNPGVAGESDTIRIGTTGTTGTHTATFVAGIFNATTSGGIPVYVDASGKLGTLPSSQRFKDQIKPMDKESEALLSLTPVTFRYKPEIDPRTVPQFGLIAEEVEKVNPDLVARDADGKTFTVRYEAVNAMLLNEFLKQHRKVQDQETAIAHLTATVAQQQRGLEVLTTSLKEQAAQIQKVSARIEVAKPAPQMAGNNH
jgi:hypothetical protein